MEPPANPGRFTQLNASLLMRHPDDGIIERKLPDAETLRDALENTIGLAFSAPAETVWARLPECFVPA